MNYRHVYCAIIRHAKSEEKLGIRVKGNGNYYEAHHILPKSLFPLWNKRKSNVVLLTAREHFFCHQLLVKIYPCYKMALALQRISHQCNGDLVLSSRDYQTIRETLSYYQKRCKWYTNGKQDIFSDKKPEGFIEGRCDGYKKGLVMMQSKGPWNKGTKGLQVAWNKGKHIDNHWTGKHHTEEAKKKMSEARKGKEPWNKGVACSDEQKKAISLKNKGRKQTPEACLRKSLANAGKVWWTNGIDDKFAVECPSGYYKGRTKVKGWKNKNGD